MVRIAVYLFFDRDTSELSEDYEDTDGAADTEPSDDRHPLSPSSAHRGRKARKKSEKSNMAKPHHKGSTSEGNYLKELYHNCDKNVNQNCLSQLLSGHKIVLSLYYT